MFKVGDVVVYSSHGVARITEIREEKIRDSQQLCYILKTVKGTLIKLPVDKVQARGFRKVVNEQEVPKVIEILRKRGPRTASQIWSRRMRDYQEKMKTGSIYMAAEVLRDLSLLKQIKDLSYGERRIFDQAWSLLINELSIVKKTDASDIERTINQIFSKPTPSTLPDEPHG